MRTETKLSKQNQPNQSPDPSTSPFVTLRVRKPLRTGLPTSQPRHRDASSGQTLPVTNYQSLISDYWSLITDYRSLLAAHPQASLILLAFIILAIIYSLATPPLEAGDESRHYAVVKYMADTGRLIVQNAPETQHLQHHWSHEGNQPPLYYVLAAALTGWIDTGDWADVFWYNPHTTIGNPLRPDNKNITIHPPGEAWPWRGHVVAVYLVRFLSIAMAAVTVAAAYAIALSLFKGNRWLAAGAMAITAFNPMFIFISASVNNDNAVIMFVTLALWMIVRMGEGKMGRWEDREEIGKADSSSAPLLPCSPAPLLLRTPAPLLLRTPALLGLLIALGALSKLYAFGLLPLAVLLLLWRAYRHQLLVTNHQSPDETSNLRSSTFWRNALRWNTILIAVFLAVAGWFYLRNAVLYDGDIFALQVMRETAGQRQDVPSLATIRAEFEGFRIAYWALFGGVNILADSWIYKILDAVSLVAAVGVIVFAIRFWISLARLWRDFRFPIFTENTRDARHITRHASRLTHQESPLTFLILLLWYLIVLAGFVVWNLTQPAGQGRLMYPAIAAISALGMLGLTWWLPASWRRWVAIGCSVGLFVFALLSPFRYIIPAYAKPPILTQAELPADLHPLNLTYDGKLRLIGYQGHAGTVRPAQTLPLTLYWELLEPTDLDYSIFVHLLGRQRQVIGQLDTYPGGGKWPATLLQPGDILADFYEVPISPQTESEHAPTRLQIAAGIYDFNEAGRPGKAVVNEAGQPVDPIIAEAKLVPWQWPDPPRFETTFNFFDKATLLSYDLAGDHLTLNWQAEQFFETDYTVFIQAWQAETGEYAAGFDGPPVQNDYPTSLWAPGEIVVDTHPLDLSALPSGEYDLWIGLYDPMTDERLPAFGPDGRLPHDAVTVGTLRIDGSKE